MSEHNLAVEVVAREAVSAYEKDRGRVAEQMAQGEQAIFGVMIESHLEEGRQDLNHGALTYGQSITDGCIGWQDTEQMLRELADAVVARRNA